MEYSHIVKILTIAGIYKFINMINTLSQSWKQEKYS